MKKLFFFLCAIALFTSCSLLKNGVDVGNIDLVQFADSTYYDISCHGHGTTVSCKIDSVYYQQKK